MNDENNHINETMPWRHPKSTKEDPQAEELVKNLIGSDSYKIALEDIEFMNSYEARGIRLELDYLKAELVMNRLGIEHTIAVFGSARTIEYKTAKKKLNLIQKELDKNPSNQEMRSKMNTAQRMLEKSVYYDDARRFGSLVGSSGKGADDCRVTIITGGGPGIMEAANRGAFDVGAKSIGLNINLPHEQFPNPYITPELCFQFHYFAIRKLHFLNRAKALVVYPGGFGTFDELFEILTLVQTQKSAAIPIVLVSKYFWNRAVNLEFLREEGVISYSDIEIFHIVDNADEAWKFITQWYEKKGEPLFNHKKE
ncbi:TIGR00730 family Rossman fold protein [Sulfurimonas sp. HSL-1716]|uniref:LOG family protein n=1 Tax=Hydrocurvibacter sulfurireducens TaxID=3131937 RepID=UPI0031F97C3C